MFNLHFIRPSASTLAIWLAVATGTSIACRNIAFPTG
jgi:hypothetical protein